MQKHPIGKSIAPAVHAIDEVVIVVIFCTVQ